MTATITTILTEDQICERFNVTPEEIDRAMRCIDLKTGDIFYIVSSRSGGDDHKVTYDRKEGALVCTCKAGKGGRKCWARRAAMASARLDYQAKCLAAAKREAAKHEAIQAQARAAVDAQMAELEKQREAARAAVAGLKSGKNVKQARAFSLLA